MKMTVLGGGCQTGMIVSLFLPPLFFVTKQERWVFCLSHVCAPNRCLVDAVHDLSVQSDSKVRYSTDRTGQGETSLAKINLKDKINLGQELNFNCESNKGR